jgi:hypothetical protein
MPSRSILQAAADLTAVTPSAAYRNAAEDLRLELPKKRTYWERRYGIRKMAEYLSAYLPELNADEPFDFDRPMCALEIGPGIGLWMEFMRSLGHEVSGIDSAPVNARLQLYKDMTNESDLAIYYIGFEEVMASVDAGKNLGRKANRFDLVHLRGSLDAVVGTFTEDVQRKRTDLFAFTCSKLLAPGGLVHISHNRNGMLPLILEALERSAHLTFEQLDSQTTRHRRTDG